jgi:16S rRNA (guanine527-N7)-methyltransferase
MGVDAGGPAPVGALLALLDAMAAEPQNLTAIADPLDAVDRHLADSLAALALPEVARAGACVDVGSGAGFPGLALAAARPGMAVTLVESERRKADWLRRASAPFPNVRVVADRSEHLAAAERERWPLATARALASPPAALELLAPLVEVGGAVVLWRGDDPGPDADARAAAGALGLEPRPPVPVRPFPGARRRLQVFAKVAPTPARFPRRPGRAAKRPLGAGG